MFSLYKKQGIKCFMNLKRKVLTIRTLVRTILHNDIHLIILKILQEDEKKSRRERRTISPWLIQMYNKTYIIVMIESWMKTYLLLHLSMDVCQSLLTIKALVFQMLIIWRCIGIQDAEVYLWTKRSLLCALWTLYTITSTHLDLVFLCLYLSFFMFFFSAFHILQ